jgi:hypothetical protein
MNNLVPKDTVDNIMKTYENIIKTHMEKMEQISKSINELSGVTTSCNEDILDFIRDRVVEIKNNMEQSLITLKSALIGPNPDHNTNLEAMQEHMEENTVTNGKILMSIEGVKENVSQLKGKLPYYIGFMVAILGIVSFVYIMVQRANETMLEKSLEKAVTKLIETRPESYYRFQFLDKDKNGIIDAKELEQLQTEINRK